MAPHRCSIELAVPPQEVWRALTDPELLAEWFGARVRMDARPGGAVVLRFQDGRERIAIIEAFQAPRLLLLRFLPLYRDPAGSTRQASTGHLRFVATPCGQSTLLEVEDSLGLGASDFVLSGVAD